MLRSSHIDLTLLLCTTLGSDKENKANPLTTLMFNNVADFLSKMQFDYHEFLVMDKSARKSLMSSNSDFSVDFIDRVNSLLSRGVNLAIELERLDSVGIKYITRTEKDYPKYLREKLKKKSPPVIFFAGDISLGSSVGISVVGSRNADTYAEDFTKKLVQKACEEGLTIYSGGARGIDSVAQSSAIYSKGKCVAVLADSLAKKALMKENRDAINKGLLLLMTTVNPYSSFRAYNAMDRNKYIYAASHIAFIVSSDKGRGGTWEGAIENKKMGLVDAYVRIDDHSPEGNHHLVKNGLNPCDVNSINENLNALTNLIKKSINNRANNSNNSNKVTNDKVNRSVHQLSLYEIADYSVPNSYEKTEKSETRLKELDNRNSNLNLEREKNINSIRNPIDLYVILLPELLCYLSEKKRLNEIAKHFNVVPTQMKAWLERAISEGDIIKDKQWYISANVISHR